MSDWSKAAPAAPGFYWMRDARGAHVVHVLYGISGLRVSMPGANGDTDLHTLVARRVEWKGPLETPKAWTHREPSEPGWYWVKGPRQVATVVQLFLPWGEAGPLWVAATGLPERPLREARLDRCEWAGPLAP